MNKTRQSTLRQLRWPLRLTRLGMVAERATRAFWPFWSVVMALTAATMFGLHDLAALEIVWAVSAAGFLAAAATLVRGLLGFRMPTRGEALDRLDRGIPGRPIAALSDSQAAGADDVASRAVWNAHVSRMAALASEAKPPEPDLRVSSRDPFALRYVALAAFVMATLFGSIWQAASLAGMSPGAQESAGPSWEGWIEPLGYTGKPSLYLNDIVGGAIEVPEGSRAILRLYGDPAALEVEETVSAGAGVTRNSADGSLIFDIAQSGRLAIAGRGGGEWNIRATADESPEIHLLDEIERGANGEMRQAFRARDDYEVTAGKAEIELDLHAVERRHGLIAEPEPREAIILDLPTPITGDRAEFEETLIENLSRHPWAKLPVRLTMTAEDALGQTGRSETRAVELPGRRFFDPLASAIIEQRRDLLWTRENGARVARILRAVGHLPDEVFRDAGTYLKFRAAILRLETYVERGLTSEQQDEIALALWDVAVSIEDGILSDALARLRRAQERLSEAMREGANDEEIAELMREMREAMRDYIRQLAEQGRQDGPRQAESGETQEITAGQLQEMLDRLQELMEQGRMDEARQLLDRLSRMMENMRITLGPGGQRSPGQRAMDELAETLRRQQDLSDDTFGDLQEQFGQGQQGGQDQQGQQGQQGGQGAQGRQPGREGGESRLGQGGGGPEGQGLAGRQGALQQELDRLTRSLPGYGSPEGNAAREALDRAGRAMENAEGALREENFADALDSQAEAMEALREGMRNLGRAMAQQRGGRQGGARGQAGGYGLRDPLGRDAGSRGDPGSDRRLLQGDDVYRRARELLDEIRRRSGEQERPDLELDYLRRLLERF